MEEEIKKENIVESNEEPIAGVAYIDNHEDAPRYQQYFVFKAKTCMIAGKDKVLYKFGKNDAMITGTYGATIHSWYGDVEIFIHDECLPEIYIYEAITEYLDYIVEHREFCFLWNIHMEILNIICGISGYTDYLMTTDMDYRDETNLKYEETLNHLLCGETRDLMIILMEYLVCYRDLCTDPLKLALINRFINYVNDIKKKRFDDYEYIITGKAY